MQAAYVLYSGRPRM